MHVCYFSFALPGLVQPIMILPQVLHARVSFYICPVARTAATGCLVQACTCSQKFEAKCMRMTGAAWLPEQMHAGNVTTAQPAMLQGTARHYSLHQQPQW
jgi:hypothetical protein